MHGKKRPRSSEGEDHTPRKWFVVAIGQMRGTYRTQEAAEAAAGSGPRHIDAFDDEDSAKAFLQLFVRANEVVYTDGACLRNGRRGAKGGIGVYWGPKDKRNVSRHSAIATNNAAELEAIHVATQQMLAQRALVHEGASAGAGAGVGAAVDGATCARYTVLATDSKYALDCITTWYARWMKNGWKTTTGTDVANRDLIIAIRGDLDRLGSAIKFVHVRGHGDTTGNIEADKLATEAAKFTVPK